MCEQRLSRHRCNNSDMEDVPSDSGEQEVSRRAGGWLGALSRLRADQAVLV